jgi:hypothetical protein
MPVSASRTTGKRVVRTKTNTWTFPYCAKCVEHVNAWNAAGAGGMIAVAIILALGSLLVHPILSLAIGVGGIWLAVSTSRKRKDGVRAMLYPECTSAQRAVDYLGWSGTVETFDIRSERYALRFVRDNAGKAVNLSPEVWSKLNAAPGPHATSFVPQVVAAEPRTVAASKTQDDDLHRWIERIENAKGPATRRNAIELGLKVLTGDHRAKFIKLAAQVELRATIDKVDSLKTPAAKRRHLADAINALRNDSIQDELQASEISALEELLASV